VVLGIGVSRGSVRLTGMVLVKLLLDRLRALVA
jgi:hypothetical protein